MNKHLISYYIGILIILFSHIYTLITKKEDTMMVYHSIANILAVFLIAYYFMNKENFIQF